ncbi:uncharacterized protein LAESUDRAFT_489336 [Laetiporus sulphureus 93-53]|uniref:Uncharacterized protein n=1 Tax=Laetiporus sulphureus 93-53 TaxID=1314785 RepID=A0A165BK59_9APHY|nr:uncharacterized protein LAESUDRAFT_489336 [Laetiporus sulphureus 93-53]KZT01208.1 hypothetical protein LAESUDRAFT_489336 [Laetiporus sulphureus 93-53]
MISIQVLLWFLGSRRCKNEHSSPILGSWEDQVIIDDRQNEHSNYICTSKPCTFRMADTALAMLIDSRALQIQAPFSSPL